MATDTVFMFWSLIYSPFMCSTFMKETFYWISIARHSMKSCVCTELLIYLTFFDSRESFTFPARFLPASYSIRRVWHWSISCFLRLEGISTPLF